MMDVINGGADPTKAILTFGLHLLAHYPEHIKAIVKEYDHHAVRKTVIILMSRE